MADQTKSSDQAVYEIESALSDMEALADSPGKDASSSQTASRASGKSKQPGVSLPARILAVVFGLAAALILPFLILVRVAVWLDQNYVIWPSFALLGGVVATTALLFLYAAYVRWRYGGGFRIGGWMKRVVPILVLVYCVYAVMYVSVAHTQNEDVRVSFTELHPVLRLAVSTWILADADLVITDASRSPEDYDTMGLARLDRSLHYVQDSGYAQAVDLRTLDRSEWKNFLMTLYFKLSGFRTLRHGGTADHLHVSLPVD